VYNTRKNGLDNLKQLEGEEQLKYSYTAQKHLQQEKKTKYLTGKNACRKTIDITRPETIFSRKTV
jgi:hypothetical protein